MTQPNAVCLLCRLRLLTRHPASPRPAWQAPARTFGAAAGTRTTPALDATGTDATEARELPPRTAVHKPTSNTLRRPSGGSAKDDRIDRIKEKRRAQQAAAAVAVFKNVVEGKDGKDDGPAATDNLATMELYKCVAILEEMLSKPDVSTADCFQYFNSEIYARTRRQQARVPRILRDQIGKQMINRVSREKMADFDAKDLPSVTLISQIFLELGLFEPDAWSGLSTALLEHICSISTSHEDYTTIESYETAMARRDTLLHDLVGAWRMFNVPPYVAARTGDGSKAASSGRLPSLDSRLLAKNNRQGKPHLSVASLFPHYPPRALRRTIPAAIATYVLLVDPMSRTNRIFRHEVDPFVDAMGTVLLHSRPTREELNSIYSEYPALLSYVTKRWSAVESQLGEQHKSQDHPDDVDESQVDPQIKRIHRQLGQAWNTWNPKKLDRAWEDFWGTSAKPTGPKLAKCRENPELFDYFIMAYMAMRQPSRAAEIWNLMVSVGIQPTIKTWTSMIDGCKRASNLHALKGVWDRLLQSKTKLDTAIWTARVSGLIELGSPEEGLIALDEMARLWKADQRLPAGSKNPAAVQPTIEPVNAALAGLMRLQRLSPGATSTLLGWAAKQGIEPDVYTFNTLLRPLLRQGLDDEVQSLLKTMKRQNIDADVVTFTILAEGALEDISNQAPQAQVKTVHAFLRNMRDAGVTGNMQLYAKMIHLLLQQGDRTEEPVKALLAHIWGQGLELTSHIYTMLAEHYFGRSPPDSDAVTALIKNRRLADNRDIDRVFWEIVIVGYCRANDVARAFKIFDRLAKSGYKMRLSTLYELLLVLGRAGQMSSIARVVDFAVKAPDQLDEQVAGRRLRSPRFWHHRFWHLAKSYGFSRDEPSANPGGRTEPQSADSSANVD